MKTHIRMHFDKKNADCNEENYIHCILGDDNSDATSNHIQRTPAQTSVINSISNNMINPISRSILNQGNKTPHLIDDDAAQGDPAATLSR